MTYKDLERDPQVVYLIKRGNENVLKLGYTEHGLRHAGWVARRAGLIMRKLGYPKRDVALAEIAGFLHDIGNVVNRQHHEETGALLAFQLLRERGMSFEDAVEVMVAIGHHHEENGDPVTPIAAALIIADKADVHRSRVVRGEIATDIHDRVNYAATHSEVEVDPSGPTIAYRIEIDVSIAPVIEYFEIFTGRMLIASRAARALGAAFQLWINGTRML